MLMGVLMMGLLCKLLSFRTNWRHDMLTNFDDSRPIPFNATLTPRFPNPLNLHTPQHKRQLNGQHTLSHMSARADTSAKAKRHIALFLGSKRTRLQLTCGLVDESTGVKHMSIRACLTGSRTAY